MEAGKNSQKASNVASITLLNKGIKGPWEEELLEHAPGSVRVRV